MAEYALVEGVEAAVFKENLGALDGADIRGWERLDWVADDHIRKECVTSHTRAKKLIDDSDDSVLWFEDYGADWVKSVGECSTLHA